jgi:hypothetical protein
MSSEAALDHEYGQRRYRLLVLNAGSHPVAARTLLRQLTRFN